MTGLALEVLLAQHLLSLWSHQGNSASLRFTLSWPSRLKILICVTQTFLPCVAHL